jgi:4,4'-diaponeurosporenoate glycosyltransferase
MMWLAAACALGFPVGFLLLLRMPRCRSAAATEGLAVSVIVPARNEEHNLPALLGSLTRTKLQPAEVIVVDDASTDATARVARSFGATVVASRSLPAGWTGKTWACHQGAIAAHSDTLFFMDADTFFVADGFGKIIDFYSSLRPKSLAMSVLPYHVMHRPYEELSLIFNLLMAMGAGGFGVVGRPRLFGQSLLISRELYQASGGHKAVAGHILENLALSAEIQSIGGKCFCIGGRDALRMRMFPDGLGQLCEGWTKAFADGAASSGPAVLAASIYWLTAMCTDALLLLFDPGHHRAIFAALYLGFAAQLFWFARRVGKYSVFTCLVYPLPLLFYFGLFGRSLYLRMFRRQVAWRGRNV